MINTTDNGTLRMLGVDEVDKARPLVFEFRNGRDLPEEDEEAQQRWIDIWQATIESKTGGIIGLDVEGQLVGVMAFLVGYSPIDGVLQLTHVHWYTLKEHRGQGMLLLEAAEDLAMALGCERIMVGSPLKSKVDRLGKIFKRRGFKPAETYYQKDI